jgi:hypothetical protein
MLVSLCATAALSFPWQTVGYYFGSWETVMGFWTWTEYVDDGTDYRYLPLLRALREQTPDDAKILLLFEPRGLYLPRTHVIGTPFFQEQVFTPPKNFAEPGQVMQQLERHQITHIVLSKSSTGPDRAAEWWERLEPWLRSLNECARQGKLQVVWESDEYFIFAVR